MAPSDPNVQPTVGKGWPLRDLDPDDLDSREALDLRNAARQMTEPVKVDCATGTIVWPDGRIEWGDGEA
jgi:hypothetical protein